MMGPNVDDELIEVLKNASIGRETRSQGWGYVLSLSASDDGLNHIVNSKKYVPFILSYIRQENEEKCIRLAYKCLINISTKEHGAFAILASRKDFCDYLLHTICDKNTKFLQFKCYLLANISTYDQIAMKIISIFLSSEGLFQKLVNVYCFSELKVQNQYDFLTLVFANISRLTEGRRLFLEAIDFMTSILKFTRASESESRRLGAALILRNCCLETDYHDRLLKDIGIVPALIFPLVVPQEYEERDEMGKLPPEWQRQCLEEVKEREPSLSVRRVLVQALTVLCYTENGWRYLMSNGVYYVVRELHKNEEDEVTKDIIEHLVTYFLIEEYFKPRTSTFFSNDNSDLIKQLESDTIKDLPDFVLKAAIKDEA